MRSDYVCAVRSAESGFPSFTYQLANLITDFEISLSCIQLPSKQSHRRWSIACIRLSFPDMPISRLSIPVELLRAGRRFQSTVVQEARAKREAIRTVIAEVCTAWYFYVKKTLLQTLLLLSMFYFILPVCFIILFERSKRKCELSIGPQIEVLC